MAAIACALLLPVALVVPALVALTLVTAVWVGLHAYELIWWREARAKTRAQHCLPQPADQISVAAECQRPRTWRDSLPLRSVRRDLVPRNTSSS